MIPEWAVEEFQTLDLGDTRRDSRLIKILADLVPQPTVSLLAAVGGSRAETEVISASDSIQTLAPAALSNSCALLRCAALT